MGEFMYHVRKRHKNDLSLSGRSRFPPLISFFCAANGANTSALGPRALSSINLPINGAYSSVPLSPPLLGSTPSLALSDDDSIPPPNTVRDEELMVLFGP